MIDDEATRGRIGTMAKRKRLGIRRLKDRLPRCECDCGCDHPVHSTASRETSRCFMCRGDVHMGALA